MLLLGEGGACAMLLLSERKASVFSFAFADVTPYFSKKNSIL
jgi:hypothetical protein